MLQVVFVKIADMGIEAVAVKFDIRLGIARGQPCLLYRNIDVLHARGERTMSRFAHPVVTVVSDRRDQLVLWNHLARQLQILGKPVL